jgi:two-component system nitrate/nitrite response regulator NarL
VTVIHAGTPQALRILMVDEHALHRAALPRFLEAQGEKEGIPIEVAQVATGPDEIRPEDRLDVALLGMASAAETMAALDKLRLRLPDIPVAVLSDRADTTEVVMALEAGARGFISTRTDPVLMLHALRFIAVGGHFFPPEALLGGSEGSAIRAGQDPVAAALVARDASPASGGLTSRQCEVLRLLQEGQSNKLIARTLGLRESTIKVHVRQIMRRLGVSNRTQAALTSIRLPVEDAVAPPPPPPPHHDAEAACGAGDRLMAS